MIIQVFLVQDFGKLHLWISNLGKLHLWIPDFFGRRQEEVNILRITEDSEKIASKMFFGTKNMPKMAQICTNMRSKTVWNMLKYTHKNLKFVVISEDYLKNQWETRFVNLYNFILVANLCKSIFFSKVLKVYSNFFIIYLG